MNNTKTEKIIETIEQIEQIKIEGNYLNAEAIEILKIITQKEHNEAIENLAESISEAISGAYVGVTPKIDVEILDPANRYLSSQEFEEELQKHD